MKALILAGGSGSRLWPLSRKDYPKQFLKLDGEKTLLQRTILRTLRLVAPEDLFILTSMDYFHEVQKQIKGYCLDQNILLEPASKNTAPAIALAAKILIEQRQCSPNELLFIAPSDHLISPEDTFVEAVQRGAKKALESQNIMIFGIYPHRPETGYGYIHANSTKVFGFVEKPSLEKAQEYLLQGNYFWNSGMFLFSLETLLRELDLHAPLYSSFIRQGSLNEFSSLPSLSFDYALMEKTSSLSMTPLHLSWSDVGSWENVYEVLEKDADANVLRGDIECQDTSGSLILAHKRLIATMGIKDMFIIETEDAVLVAKRDEAQKVRDFVEKLKLKGKKQAQEHMTSHRPWGSYTVLEEGVRYKIKRIQVNPQEKLSLQLHYHRSEHWIVVKGTAKATINEKEIIVHEGESIFVPKSAIHRLENPGKVALEMIEVQVGEYLGEDDIIRLEDVYGRLKEEEAFQLLLHNRPIPHQENEKATDKN